MLRVYPSIVSAFSLIRYSNGLFATSASVNSSSLNVMNPPSSFFFVSSSTVYFPSLSLLYSSNENFLFALYSPFTFFLAIPVMFGASLLKIAKFGLSFTASQAVILLAAMIVAFVVSVVVIKFLMGYIKKHDFKVFGWYRIILGTIVLVYYIFKTVSL